MVQSGQGADEVLGGYDWYPPIAGVGRERRVEAYREAFFDRPHDEMARAGAAADCSSPSDPSRDVRRASTSPGRARRTPVDAALRLDTR